MNHNMAIKHISFDVWNTLITANPQYAKARSSAIALVAKISKEQAAEAYATVKKQLDYKAEHCECGSAEDSWDALGLHLGLNQDKTREMQRLCEDLFRALPPNFNHNLVNQLMDLSCNYEISIKSNTNFISGAILSEVIGFDRMPFWSFMHFSDHWYMCKPDILFFLKTLICSKLDNLAPDEVIHVGDSKIFDGKCVDYGFNFCHIKNPQDLLDKLEKGEIINA